LSIAGAAGSGEAVGDEPVSDEAVSGELMWCSILQNRGAEEADRLVSPYTKIAV
jgi:hypothetical protein